MLKETEPQRFSWHSLKRIIPVSLAIIPLIPSTPIEATVYERSPVVKQAVQNTDASSYQAQCLKDAIPLTQRESAKGELSGGRSSCYKINLLKNQYLHLVVDQRGIDVILKLYGPDDKQPDEYKQLGDYMDSPNGDQGPEFISVVSSVAGDYELEIQSPDKRAPTGKYEVRIDELINAKDEHRKYVTAERAYAHGSIQLSAGIEQNRLDYIREAIKSLEPTVPVFQSLRKTYQEALARNYVGIAYKKTSVFQKVLDYLLPAIPLWRTLRDRRGEAEALSYIAGAYKAMGNNEKAIENYEPALSIWHELGDRYQEGQALSSAGEAYYVTGERGKGLDYFIKSLPLRRAVHDRRGEAETLHNMAIAYSDLGKKQKAIDLFTQALGIADSLKDTLGKVNIFTGLGQVYDDLGEKQKALDYYNKALDLWPSVGDPRGQAYAFLTVGVFFHSVDEKPKALEFFNNALMALETLKDIRGQASALGNIGAVYDSYGERQKALEFYNRALTLTRDANDRGAEAATLNNVGNFYLALGEKQKALSYYNQSLPLRRALHNRVGEAITLNNIGSLYLSMGDAEEALKYFQQALPIFRGLSNPTGEANTLHYLGTAYYSSNKQQAVAYFNQSLPLMQRLKNTRGEALVLTWIGQISHEQREEQKALNYLNRAISIFDADGDRYNKAYALNVLGLVYDQLGDQQKALERFGQSLDISETISDREREASVLYGIARIEVDQGRLEEARSHVEKAMTINESLRKDIPEQGLRISYFSLVQPPFELHMELLMRLHKQHPSESYLATALETSERARARGLLELLTEANAGVYKDAAPDLMARKRSLEKLIESKKELIKELSSNAKEVQYADAMRQLKAVEGELQAIEDKIRDQNKRYKTLAQPRSAKEIQKMLDQNTILLEYALGQEHSYIWAVTQESIDMYELPKRSKIEDSARPIYEMLSQKNQKKAGTVKNDPENRSYAKKASGLSQILLGPVASRLERKRLLIIGDGILQYIPFSALPDPYTTKTSGDEWRPLVLNHEIVNLPSASTLALMRDVFAGRPPAPKTLAVFADPVFTSRDIRFKQLGLTLSNRQADIKQVDEAQTKKLEVERAARESGVLDPAQGWQRVPFTSLEAKWITAPEGSPLPETEALLAKDFQASRDDLLRMDLAQYRIIHFATHGILDSTHPEFSAVVMSLVDKSGNSQDGFLSLSDIYGLKLSADLIVLSACQTGLGKEIRGEGLVGLTRGFMYAGATSVVASLWQVDTHAAAEFMKNFYNKMLGAQSRRPSAALREAQIEMWNHGWRYPGYWAAFTLQGEWR